MLNFIITLLILIIVLGVIVFIHELGHFLAAKKVGVYVHEFAVGMGPKIWSFKRKNDETTYSLRLLPLGGFTALASDKESGKGLKKDQILENKTGLQKFFVLINGIIFNMILGVILLFINGLIYGSPDTSPYVGEVVEGTPASKTDLRSGDLILKVNDKKVSSWDDVLLETRYGKMLDKYTFLIERDGREYSFDITPEYTTNEEGEVTPTFGFTSSNIKKTGLLEAIKYGFVGTYKSITSVFNILIKLITGKIGADNLSGPIGVYSVIDTIKSSGLENIIYLTAYLSVNVGVINLIPIPVFDGGRILILLIESITKKKANPKLETWLNGIGVVLLVILMIYVMINDIIKLV